MPCQNGFRLGYCSFHGLTSWPWPKSVRTVKQATQWGKANFFMEAKMISIELIIAISPGLIINLIFAYLLSSVCWLCPRGIHSEKMSRNLLLLFMYYH